MQLPTVIRFGSKLVRHFRGGFQFYMRQFSLLDVPAASKEGMVGFIPEGPFSEGLAVVEKDYRRGYIDKAGKIVIPAQYNDARTFSEGLAAVKTNEKWGYIEKSGQVVIPAQFDEAGSFSEGLAPVKINYKWGYIDRNGIVVIPLRFEMAYSFC